MIRYTVRATTCLCAWLLSAACGSGNFSDDFAQEIQKDCNETVGCAGLGSVDKCIDAAGKTADNWNVERQQLFVDTVTRCQDKTRCDYVNCASNDPNSGYAGQRQPQILFECQQQVQCLISSGTMVPTTAVQDCVLTRSAQLNAATLQDQANFDARISRCSTQYGCAYNVCL